MRACGQRRGREAFHSQLTGKATPSPSPALNQRATGGGRATHTCSHTPTVPPPDRLPGHPQPARRGSVSAAARLPNGLGVVLTWTRMEPCPPWKPGAGSARRTGRVCPGSARPAGRGGVQEEREAPSEASWAPLLGRVESPAWRAESELPVDLPGSEAGWLGPRGRVHAFPGLSRFLSVHLLKD